MAEGQRNNAKPKRRRNVTLPTLSVDITLNTVFAQRVYDRVWDSLKGHIFTLTVRSRALGREDVAEAAETILKEYIEKLREDINADITRADHLMDELGIKELGRYDGAQKVSADYTTPQAKQYLDMVLGMDQLIMRMEALWLNGEIDTKQCKDRSYEWQRRLLKVANRIRQSATSGKKTLDEAQEARNRARKKSSDTAPTEAVAKDDEAANTPEKVSAANGADKDSAVSANA